MVRFPPFKWEVQHSAPCLTERNRFASPHRWNDESMTKSELIQPIAYGQAPLATRDVELAVNLMLERMAACLAAGDLIGTYAFRRAEALDSFRPQLRKVAEYLTRWNPSPRPAMIGHHFGDFMKWLLEQGRENPDASAAGVSLTRVISNSGDHGAERLIQPLLPLLLGNFPDIAWQILGQTVISDPVRAYRLGNLLKGSQSSEERHDAPILSLPEDVLIEWCRAHPGRAPRVHGDGGAGASVLRQGCPGSLTSPLHGSLA